MSKFQTIYSIIISCNYVNVNINFVFNQKKTKLNHKKAHLKHQTETFHSHSNRVRKILLPLLAARPMCRFSGILPQHGAAHQKKSPEGLHQKIHAQQKCNFVQIFSSHSLPPIHPQQTKAQKHIRQKPRAHFSPEYTRLTDLLCQEKGAAHPHSKLQKTGAHGQQRISHPLRARPNYIKQIQKPEKGGKNFKKRTADFQCLRQYLFLPRKKTPQNGLAKG